MKRKVHAHSVHRKTQAASGRPGTGTAPLRPSRGPREAGHTEASHSSKPLEKPPHLMLDKTTTLEQLTDIQKNIKDAEKMSVIVDARLTQFGEILAKSVWQCENGPEKPMDYIS